jgi:hypothetical protein
MDHDTEPAEADPTDTEPADTEPADTEPTDTEPTEADLTKAGLTAANLPETGQADREPESAPEATSAPASEDSVAPAPEATGDARVDAAIAQLGDLRELPVSEHPPVFERIHGQLVEVLGELHTGASLADSAEPAESAEG